MLTYRMDVEYEGTRYSGWQEQRNARSITGELRRALAAAGAEIVELGGAGRTDAGVHALRQVAHLRLRRAIDAGRLLLEANDALPPDIHVLTLSPAASGFHARHDAISRTYLYQISRRRTALAKRGVYWVKRPLDAVRMTFAAGSVCGRHDFRQFCERPQSQQSTVVEVERVEIAEHGALILVRFCASHFLWKMVRRVVGALIRVGAGELSIDAFEDLVEGESPRGESPAAWTAPPSGLYLERVHYRGDPPLAPLAPAIAVPAEALRSPSRP